MSKKSDDSFSESFDDFELNSDEFPDVSSHPFSFLDDPDEFISGKRSKRRKHSHGEDDFARRFSWSEEDE
ncbi:MAG: hypothetical protein P1U89_00705 [Verrucomicrobiales bacterium]|nr:hypothetical protein [Verrucomicrobiales bacterium]